MSDYRPSLRDRFRTWARRSLLARLRVLTEPASTRLLDLGGGTGAATTVFGTGARELVVREPNGHRVGQGRSAGAPVVFSQGVAEGLPFGPEQFDRVVSLMSLHHFSDAQQALNEAARVLTPEGRLVVYDLDPTTRRGRLAAFLAGGVMHHAFGFSSPDEIARKLTAAGFRDVHEEKFGPGAFIIAEKRERTGALPKRL